MFSSDALAELEGQLRTIPPQFVKHDLQPGFEAMTRWIQKLDPTHRRQIIQALPRWFSNGDEWRNRAALEITLLLHEPSLLEVAIHEARRKGIEDIAAPFQYPPWLEFQLNLIRVLAEWGSNLPASAKGYLIDLRNQASHASSYSRRLLSSRAWVTLCYKDKDFKCLGDAMRTVREWRDERLLRSALTLNHAYFCGSTEAGTYLSRIFTTEELKTVCPDLVKAGEQGRSGKN